MKRLAILLAFIGGCCFSLGGEPCNSDELNQCFLYCLGSAAINEARVCYMDCTEGGIDFIRMKHRGEKFFSEPEVEDE